MLASAQHDPTRHTNAAGRQRRAEASVWAGREALVEGAVQGSDSEFRPWSRTEGSLKPSPAAPWKCLQLFCVLGFSLRVHWDEKVQCDD